MKPDHIVTSLAWSKKLKQAGWPQEGIFCYRASDGELLVGIEECNDDVAYPVGVEFQSPDTKSVVAPTAEELLRRLPQTLTHGGKEYLLFLEVYDNPVQRFQAFYKPMSSAEYVPLVASNDGNKFSDALAMVWCYLRDNKILT